MDNNQAFLIGHGQVHVITAGHGETPPCPTAQFRRGDIVKVRRNKRVGHFPAELIVLVAMPPQFSPDDALADMFGEARSLMKRVGKRVITYLLCQEGHPDVYWCRETDVLPSGKEPIEIGTISRAE